MTGEGRHHATPDGRQVREAIRRHAVAAEEAGRLGEALKAWELLMQRAGGDRALTSIARSNVTALCRRIQDQARAAQVLSGGDADVEGAISEAVAASQLGFVVEVRRLQVAQRPDARTLTALGSALRRANRLDEAAAVLDEAIQMDPSRATNRHAYIARGALLRAAGEKRAARELLEDLHSAAPADPYGATALAAVYLDYAEQNGETRLLDTAERLIGIAYAQQHDREETRGLYGRLDSLRRRFGI
jgi:tetratricopeptide (TPR) repeat protein